MVRALAICAVILAVRIGSAQTVTPTIIARPDTDGVPTIAVADAPSVSACGEHDCWATDAASSEAAKPIDQHALLRQKLAELNCLQDEINALRSATGTPEQILVKVRVLEVSRTKIQKLGIDFTELRGDMPIAIARPYAQEAAERRQAQFAAVRDGDALLGFVKQLQQNNVARVLAEPSMVIVSGRPASFHVGGQVPLPAANGKNSAVEFMKFGTQVDVLATALGENRVRLQLRANVSEVDYGKGIEVGGINVPGLSVRQIDSPFQLEFGETGVISGLVQQRTESVKTASGTVASRVNDIELLFLVTPEAVPPNSAKVRGQANGEAPYHTASSASEAVPGERSLRVTKPSSPR